MPRQRPLEDRISEAEAHLAYLRGLKRVENERQKMLAAREARRGTRRRRG